MNTHANPLIEDYLRRLRAAAVTLPAHRREELVAEIRDHLDEGLRQSGVTDEASVRNLLERLGPVEDIVNAATDISPSDQQATPLRETNSSAVVSVVLGILWLVGVGSVLALVFGYRARREIMNSGGRQQGSSLATVGIVLGWVGIALVVLVIVGGVGLISGSGPEGTSVPLPTH